jgi:hypothetical protein
MKQWMMACAALLLVQGLCAQESDDEGGGSYRNALGIRLGPSVPAVKSGITYKHFLNDSKALEGILSFGDGFTVCALYQIHKPLATDNLRWFFGAGAYVGVSNQVTNIGGAGVVGLDYRFPNLPLNLSLDWKPELNILEKIGFEGSTVGLSVRYVF